MGEDREPTHAPPEPPQEETPPPFQPDPDIVTFLERGGQKDPKQVWRQDFIGDRDGRHSDK